MSATFPVPMNATPASKWAAIKMGNRVVASDADLAIWEALDEPEVLRLASVPNPKSVGILDRYIAYLPPAPLTVEEIAAMPMKERKERLAVIKTRAARGDFAWDFGDMLRLEDAIPEELAARERLLAEYQAARDEILREGRAVRATKSSAS
jgi:hypothetical protein